MDKIKLALDILPKAMYQNQYIGIFKSIYTKECTINRELTCN